MTTTELFVDLGRMTARTWEPYYNRPTAVNGFVVTFQGPFYADVSGVRVTDYDCSRCGDHDGDRCQHFDAMLEAYQMLRSEILHPAMPDRDQRREAYYSAGLYPAKPLC